MWPNVQRVMSYDDVDVILMNLIESCSQFHTQAILQLFRRESRNSAQQIVIRRAQVLKKRTNKCSNLKVWLEFKAELTMAAVGNENLQN